MFSTGRKYDKCDKTIRVLKVFFNNFKLFKHLLYVKTIFFLVDPKKYVFLGINDTGSECRE